MNGHGGRRSGAGRNQTARMAALILHRLRILAFPRAAGSSGGHRGTLD